jgi:hypothetical protein
MLVALIEAHREAPKNLQGESLAAESQVKHSDTGRDMKRGIVWARIGCVCNDPYSIDEVTS